MIRTRVAEGGLLAEAVDDRLGRSLTMTRGIPLGLVPAGDARVEQDGVGLLRPVGEDDRGQPDGELAAAEGGGEQVVGVAGLGDGAAGRRVDVAERQVEVGDVDVGQVAAVRGAPSNDDVREERPGLAVVERAVDPGVARDVEHRVGRAVRPRSGCRG